MFERFDKHYCASEHLFEERLSDFQKFRGASHEELFEEMAFCIFAANSSAEMGLKAVELLKPVMHLGDEEAYVRAVKGKVRFYNVRSKYLFYNKRFLEENNYDFRELLDSFEDVEELRDFLARNFKGFGMKEASHFLRNVGFRGFCIVDKHVIRVMHELGEFESVDAPKNKNEYLSKEKRIQNFAKNNGYCVDKLDLALWSFKTGKIIK